MNAAGADVHYPFNKVALIAYSVPFASVSTGMSSSIVIVQIIFPFIWPLHLYFPFLVRLLIVSVIKFCCFPAFRLLEVTLLLLQSLFILLPFVLYSVACERLWTTTLFTTAIYSFLFFLFRRRTKRILKIRLFWNTTHCTSAWFVLPKSM
jgi:hypothetical protein